jgi:hypothetical protein
LHIDIVISTNITNPEDDYPTIEADVNALEAPLQKSISTKGSAANTPKQFGCQSYCQNQGVCVLAAQSINCRCPTGYTGIQCQVARKIRKKKTKYKNLFLNQDFPISTRQGCTPDLCDNGGTCTEVYPNTIVCTCPPGYIGSLCSYPGNHRIAK